MTQIIKRLPEVKTLYDILPKGAEGGKEFARIIDLLIFHEAQRRGEKCSIFSDVSGDYYGLDSFEGDVFRKEGTIGYQYKFYPSPLSANHRKEIVESLKKAANNQKKLKLKKWILVTPQDFIESSTRGDKGDVTWFEGLRDQIELKFEIEHWGHKNLIAKFLDTPSICLFYYPELTEGGTSRKRTIEDTQKRYNDNLVKLYRDIQFVGMSVYKQEATKGVPMEHIYIPLSVIPESADNRNVDTATINPLLFLNNSTTSVILGDPGSGKSTLLRFLSLSGISKPLQERYKAKADKRLNIFVTLRRYADELKSRQNLSLIDYVQESINGDFNLKSADLAFLEYFLESGKAILLFDGLDELPNPQFKQIVRDRIRALITTYPGNTILVTSRIVGYDNPFRFDEEEFRHYRLTKLKLPEMEQFVSDWYRVRIENPRERKANVDDLIRILRDEDHLAIRELSENPLLLTIVALVHRIDAVLPDERVVLYQKCTETLLNTWHTWKFRETETRNKGKLERRNRRRMEAIANWMHCRIVSAKKTERAVVTYEELLDFLTKHIEENEKMRDSDNDPEDMAQDFLEFIKKKAGLLIEVGDGKYSFVHLTFQEYLTSSHILTKAEKDGASGIWNIIKKHLNDPGWHEVVRLLIAGLKNEESQRFLIKKMLQEFSQYNPISLSQLLAGLLLDGIESAEEFKNDIVTQLIIAGNKVEDYGNYREIIAILDTWLLKEASNEDVIELIFKSLQKKFLHGNERVALRLTAASLHLGEKPFLEIVKKISIGDEKFNQMFNLFLNMSPNGSRLDSLKAEIERFGLMQNAFVVQSPHFNFIAASAQAITSSMGLNTAAISAFELHMVALGALLKGMDGPFEHLIRNGLVFSDKTKLFPKIRSRRRVGYSKSYGAFLGLLSGGRVRRSKRSANTGTSELAACRLRENYSEVFKLMEKFDTHRLSRLIENDNEIWRNIYSTPDIYWPIIELIRISFNLEPRFHWQEALKIRFLPDMPKRMIIYDEALWEQTEESFRNGRAGVDEIYFAAWLLLLDAWLYLFKYYEKPDESIFRNLRDLTRTVKEPPLQIALCINDMACGDESRTLDLLSMVRSKDKDYRQIFERCLWCITEEEEPMLRQMLMQKKSD